MGALEIKFPETPVDVLGRRFVLRMMSAERLQEYVTEQDAMWKSAADASAAMQAAGVAQDGEDAELQASSEKAALDAADLYRQAARVVVGYILPDADAAYVDDLLTVNPWVLDELLAAQMAAQRPRTSPMGNLLGLLPKPRL